MRISDWSSDVCSSDLDQEQHRVLAVDDAVVVAQRDVHHRRGDDLAVLDDGALFDRVHPEDRRLRRVDDRGRHQRTEGAAVGDGEGAALQVLELEATLARGLGIAVDAPLDVGEARSEEHTSELQSLMRISYAVFCLKKKK